MADALGFSRIADQFIAAFSTAKRCGTKRYSEMRRQYHTARNCLCAELDSLPMRSTDEGRAVA
jgi:hypothetical protein